MPFLFWLTLCIVLLYWLIILLGPFLFDMIVFVFVLLHLICRQLTLHLFSLFIEDVLKHLALLRFLVDIFLVLYLSHVRSIDSVHLIVLSLLLLFILHLMLLLLLLLLCLELLRYLEEEVTTVLVSLTLLHLLRVFSLLLLLFCFGLLFLCTCSLQIGLLVLCSFLFRILFLLLCLDLVIFKYGLVLVCLLHVEI